TRRNPVTRGEDGTGTAWPVGPHMFATNSHVGELRETLQPGVVMSVRSPGPNSRTYDVIAHKLHPGYRALKAFMYSGKQELAARDAAGNDVSLQIGVPGYDVALLEIRETIPDEQIFKL